MTRRIPHRLVCSALALLTGALACTDERARELPRPVYEGDVELLLRERCAECHGGDDAGAGYRVDGYDRVLACTERAPEQPAVQVRDGGAPLLDALEQPDHRELLTASERARLTAWLEQGAPLRDHGVHEPGILSPRDPGWHGKLAATDRFAPLTDAMHAEACGRCHAGAPVAPRGAVPAAGAPACTACHDREQGVLACGTCHGDGEDRAAPPRDRCVFGGPEHDAHAAHLRPSALREGVLECASCHPAADARLTGTHADGRLDIAFDRVLAGPITAYFGDSHTCAVACHDRGGARARPSFDQAGPLGCGDCHGAPPQAHYAGACDGCHAGVNADGSALRDASRHLNGTVDLKDGRSDCGTCHGTGDDPMPPTPGHRVHRATMLTEPIVCTECHVLPAAITQAGHLDVGERTPADVRFGERASARGREPSYEGGSCREIACHGAGLGAVTTPALRWDERPAQQCASCHGLPPPLPHPQLDTCESALCHGGEIRVGDGDSLPAITESGRALHIDGTIDARGAP